MLEELEGPSHALPAEGLAQHAGCSVHGPCTEDSAGMWNDLLPQTSGNARTQGLGQAELELLQFLEDLS